MTKSRFKKLDVRPLLDRGEEPFGTIQAALTALAPDQGLSVIAPFLPSPLVERLKAAGYNARVERRADGGWQVDFWRD
ncbi:MAG: DUF2249 domain-containing protein [Opitutaceae bacterium]